MEIVDYQYLVVDENFKIKLNERDFGRLIGLVVNDSLFSVKLSSGIVVEKSTYSSDDSDNYVEWKLYNPKTTKYVYTTHKDYEMDAFVNELMENRKALKGFDSGLQFQIQKGDRGSDSRLVFFFDYVPEVYNSFGLEEGRRFVKFLSSNIGNKFWQFAESATFVVDTSNMFNLKRLKNGNASDGLIELEHCKGNERTVVHRWKNMTDEKATAESVRLDGLLKKELARLENDDSEDDTVPEKVEAIKITEHPDSFDIVFCGNENFSLNNVSYGIIPPFVSFLKSDHTIEDIAITVTGKQNSLVFSFLVPQLHQNIRTDQADRKLMIEIPDEDDEGLSWITINQTELELLIKKLESISAGYRVGDLKVIRKGRNLTFTNTKTNRKTNMIIPVKDYPVVERYIIECLGRVLSKSDIKNSPTELSLYYSGYTENNQKTTFRVYNDGSMRITDESIAIHIDKEHVPMFLVMLKSESGKFLATIGSKEKENAEGTES